MAYIIGTNSNDTLLGTNSFDTINGKTGNDIITGNKGYDYLTGGGGNDKFVVNLDDGIVTISDFVGVGKGTNPTPDVIAEVDTLKFQGYGLTPQNLLLTQNGNSLEISFEGVYFPPLSITKVILQNFKLEDLDNLKASGSRPAIGNIIFNGQTSITDSFNVLDANSTDTSIGIKNTVTFFNDLDNNITALDNSDDVVNGQGGNDIINGLSGNDLLRGGTGNDTLIGGAGNDTLVGNAGNNLLSGDNNDDSLSVSGYYTIEYTGYQYDSRSDGNNTLNGGVGDDSLSASGSKGNNLLCGSDGSDTLSVFGYYQSISYNYDYYSESSGQNTLDGGADRDWLSASGSTGNNLLSGGDGNDFISVSGYYELKSSSDAYDPRTSSQEYDSRSSGNNTLNGGAGDDSLSASGSTGNNLLDAGDGNDFLNISGYNDSSNVDYYDEYGNYAGSYLYKYESRSLGNNTLRGGVGNDTLNAGGSTGDNLLDGGDGNDILTASNATGKNILKGGNGNDILTGGNGNDSLIGGNGVDTFVFNSFNEGVDRISDLNVTNETIRISATGFGGGLSAGVLKANQFRIGASATTSTQRFIYNSATGVLFFDRDGSAGAFAQVQFGQLSAGLSLTNNNFVVV
ncbi:calcium-binding protein [Nostoc punctiforme FACHB-252]|uniref:Calcium-binding protein n=1 Tax=Nostoc punctiforme FACHB-252 TaxID=1357509 RepID=A0ABR8HJN0_NOSPU|nr:calcium-binding protein [Nostoc punctiforme]MBD2616014.1 calcium-binding protein [Nostoc punctiforme FACHB-252]